MAHEVTMHVDTNVISNRDVTFEIKLDRSLLGRFLVSKGAVEWLPAGNSVNKWRLSWRKFAKVMVAEGKQVKQ